MDSRRSVFSLVRRRLIGKSVGYDNPLLDLHFESDNVKFKYKNYSCDTSEECLHMTRSLMTTLIVDNFIDISVGPYVPLSPSLIGMDIWGSRKGVLFLDTLFGVLLFLGTSKIYSSQFYFDVRRPYT